MRNLWAFLLMIAALSLTASATGANERKCTPADATAADAMVEQLDSWSKLETAVKKYGHCDSGSIAEGYSEAVARLLVDHWDELPTLVGLSKAGSRLPMFVLRHVDSTLDSADLERIAWLSANSCPNGAAVLCSNLRKVASHSLRAQSH